MSNCMDGFNITAVLDQKDKITDPRVKTLVQRFTTALLQAHANHQLGYRRQLFGDR